ncbi:MAG: tetratricopeptide repeat protein [Polyangiaceae bacterium]
MAVDREKVQEAARKFAEKKRFDKAIIEYQRIIQEDPNDARILLKIGELQTKMDAFQAAIETYERVGKIYVQQGFARKAIAVYLQIRDLIGKHVPQLEERYAHILPRLAELYEQCGLISDALPAYDEIATKLLKAGKDQEAIVAFRKLVELDPGNPLGHLRLAEALVKVKDLASSGQQFLVASDLLVKLGRRDDALKVLERALGFRPDPVLAKRAARMFLERAQPDDGMRALSKLQICFQANPKEIETLALLAHAFEMIGQRPKAIEVKKEIARISKDAGDESLFRGMMNELIREAPDDEVVQQLWQLAQSVPPPPQQPARQQQGPASLQRTGSQRAHQHHQEEEAEVSIEEIEEEYLEEDYEEIGSSQMMPMSTTDGVMIPSSLEVAEELGEQGTFEPTEFTAQTVAESLAYRQANLHAKALETLRIGLEVLPASIELREHLRDTLLEVGDREGAVGEMITLAAIAIDALDVERASAMLHDVLHLQPGHMRAREMLYDLGFTDDEEPAQAEQAIPIPSSEFETYNSRRPLPSYDLEEVGPGRGFASTGGMESRARDLLEADDPFDTRVPLPPQRPVSQIPPAAPLPAFSLEEEDDPFDGVPVRASQLPAGQSQNVVEAIPASSRTFAGVAPPPATHDTDAAPPRMSLPPLAGPLVSATAFQGGEAIEDALEEVDFFASRGMIEDARSVIEEQLQRAPNHPLLLDKLRELDELENEQQAASEVAPVAPASMHSGGLDDVDDILDLDSIDSFEPTQEAAPQMSQGEQVDVEAVFEMFKAGVKEQISETDSATHYDLGLSYLPMGRLEDAIQMFQISARDPKRECVSLAMIGLTEAQRGNLDAAIAAFRKALVAPARTVTEETSIYYELGDVFEKKNYRIEALESFQKAARREPDFRDVQDRIKRLEPPKSVRPKIASLDDDFDSVLDDLFEK